TNETSFIVARSTNSAGPWMDIATVAANSTGYTNNGLLPLSTYYFIVRAVNLQGASTNSNVATATTPAAPPAIDVPPQSLAVLAGQDASFSVVVSGTPPFSYQWRFNDADIPGATNDSYTLNAVTPSASGLYSVLVTNASGRTLSP